MNLLGGVLRRGNKPPWVAVPQLERGRGQRGASVIPPDIQVHPLPVEVEQLAPQLRGFGYVVIEEQIAIVDQATRKIDLTFPRWR